MITLLNRAELRITYQMEEQYRIRAALEESGIDYTIKMMDRGAKMPLDGRAGMAVYGIRQAQMLKYVIYVHRDDLEQAQFVLRHRGL